ncbi:MAG: hypothetical protein ACE5MH_09675 [Terriglobia bacterium]
MAESDSGTKDFLDLLVPQFELENATLVEALQALKAYGLKVGLELKPVQRGEKAKRFSISLSRTSIRDILDAIVGKAGRYSWTEVKRPYPTGMVNVFPSDPELRFDNVMKLEIRHFEIKGDIDPTNAINQIGGRVPELARLLGGTVGSRGTLESEEFWLVRENISLRELLNEIALRKPNLGWLFRPIRDPSAPQGVYYSWNAF